MDLPAPGRTRHLTPDGAVDRLIYPGGVGHLISRPFTAAAVTEPTEYPDGFGLTMQVMGYYEEGRGGFYFACHDPFSTRKTIHFSQTEASYEHHNCDLREGEDMDLGFPVVLGGVGSGGDWFDVAQLYRAWALAHAAWTRRGPTWRRNDRDIFSIAELLDRTQEVVRGPAEADRLTR